MILQSFVLLASITVSSAQSAAADSPGASLHAPFTAVLKQHTQHGLVDYDAIAKSQEFTMYLRSLATAKVDTMPRADRLAFWINAYNAYTIELVNRHKERESIRNINMVLGVLRGKGPWKEEIVNAGGRTMGLEAVEKMIRSEFKDLRVHMALARATMSSPPLRGEAYEGSKINEQLEDQTRVYLRERQTVNRLDLGNSLIYLSAIFEWFHADFGKGDTALFKFIAPYFDGEGEKAAFSGSRLTVEYSDYDWALNILQPRVTQ